MKPLGFVAGVLVIFYFFAKRSSNPGLTETDRLKNYSVALVVSITWMAGYLWMTL